MYRDFINDLIAWKGRKPGKPLIVTGARQVGKTYIIREFAREHFGGFIDINLYDDKKSRDYFSESRSAQDIADYISLNYPQIKQGPDTLIFFDEIQLCPELITALKFIPDRMESRIICSGSMLGVEIHRTSSFPVGYVEMLTMHPMTFSEFLMANSIETRFVDRVRECIDNAEPVPDPVHERFTELYTKYLVCGGMPESVSTYIDNGLAAAVGINRRLMSSYELDIAHYADAGTRVKALDCFRSLPLQLSKENKKFQYKLVKEGYNARHYDASLSWLKNAGLIIDVHRLKRIDTPLEIGQEQAVFKVYVFDTGLLVSQFDDDIITIILENALRAYKGVVYENMTAQVLNNIGYKSFYYEPNTSSEIDFVINYRGSITPIEVKGGLRTRSTSFDNFIKNQEIKTAIRFSRKNIGRGTDGVTLYLPHYTMEWVLEKPKAEW